MQIANCKMQIDDSSILNLQFAIFNFQFFAMLPRFEGFSQ
jgi:hypothetical protein